MEAEKIIKLQNAQIFQRENLILNNVNVDVEAGEFIYIIGKVGTGKTSLIKTLNAELPLLEGNGEVVGYQLHKIKHKEISGLRKKIGVVFQDFRLLMDRNVYQNLLFVLKATGWKDKNAMLERIDEVLNKVGAIDKKDQMPHQLSGGEQQRVVIARAILNNPTLILADEPTGNLDPETSEEILDLFIELNKAGKTILMATHDYSVIAKKSARTWVCANSKLEDSASNQNLIEFEKLLKNN